LKIKRELVVYPNSGEIWDPINKVFFKKCEKLSNEDYAKKTLQWYKDGATIIGGCC